MSSLSLSRRTALGLVSAAVAVPSLPTFAFAGKLPTLALYGPPAGPSVTLAHAVASGAFSEIAETATMTAWRNPDELRAGLTSGSIGLSVVPVQAAVNLYNRGFPIKLANVMTNGLLYIISPDSRIADIEDLKGKSIAVPFKGDTPEIIFGQLLSHHGLDAVSDLSITYAASPVEAMQLLLSGRVEAALLPEDLDKYPVELSGGMKQRVSIARALAATPDFIFFDEPFTALDVALRRRMQDLVIETCAGLGLSGLFITHDLQEAARLADRIAVLDARGQGVLGTRSLPGRPAARSDDAVYHWAQTALREDPLFRHIHDVDERQIA